MDTIIYLGYVKNEASTVGGCSYTLKEHRLQDYRVIKLLVQEQVPIIVDRQNCSKNFVRRFGRSVVALGQRMKYRYELRMQDRARKLMVEGLRQELAAMLEDTDDVQLCYDEAVGRDLWVRRLLPFREFEDYLQKEWVYRLLPEATNHHFVVFGKVSCVEEVFWKLAPHMKSLLWVVPDRTAEEEIEDFAEEFYQETGLAIRLQFLPANTSYGQLTIGNSSVREPVNILDFTGGKHIPRFEPPKGSVWLDVASDGDKERRICARGLPCKLISLRKQWKKLPFA